jgi:hypothetical protein
MSDILCMAYAGENIMNKSNPFSSILTNIRRRQQKHLHRKACTAYCAPFHANLKKNQRLQLNGNYRENYGCHCSLSHLLGFP